MIHFFLIGLLFLFITTKQVFVADIVVLVVNNMTRQQTDFLVTVTVQSPLVITVGDPIHQFIDQLNLSICEFGSEYTFRF